MTALQLAQTFAAYLLGSLAADNRDGQYGPYKMRADSDEGWQLDSSNDYWLHITGPQADLTCRYDSQEAVIKAAVALFTAKFLHDR